MQTVEYVHIRITQAPSGTWYKHMEGFVLEVEKKEGSFGKPRYTVLDTVENSRKIEGQYQRRLSLGHLGISRDNCAEVIMPTNNLDASFLLTKE